MSVRARRSNRCATCMQRKVKCDERRPECDRCVKSGLQCGGYQTRTRFVDESARFKSPRPYPSSVVEVNDFSIADVICQKQTIRSLPPDQDGIFNTHLIARFSLPCGADPSPPIKVLPRLFSPRNTGLQRVCSEALAACYFGKVMNDPGVYLRGTRLYSRALAQLRVALACPIRATSLDTLRSVLVLCIYENVIFSGPTAWLRHYDGVSRLVQLRGPSSYHTDTDKELMRFARHIVTLSVGHQRRHCFLSQPEWKRSPQALKNDTPPNAVDLLYDIFAHVPGILHDIDKLQIQDGEHPTDAVLNLRQRTEFVLRELYDWPRNLPWYVASTFQQLPTNSYSAESMGSPPPIPTDAAALALCYAILLCLSKPCHVLELQLLPLRDTPLGKLKTTSAPEAGSDDDKALAVEICRLATSALRNERSAAIAFTLVFPLQIANCHIDPHSPEQTTLEGLMNWVIADVNGLEIGRRRDWSGVCYEQSVDEVTERNFLRGDR